MWLASSLHAVLLISRPVHDVALFVLQRKYVCVLPIPSSDMLVYSVCTAAAAATVTHRALPRVAEVTELMQVRTPNAGRCEMGHDSIQECITAFVLLQDPAEYFQPPGGLLTFDMHLGDRIEQSVPYQQDANPANSPAKSMKLDDAKMGHFNLVHAQLQQVSY